VQSIQLYIEGQRVDMFKDESVTITQSIQNVRDIAKVFTEFTRTFTIPASKKNNKVFKHYYNFDIDGGFDARIKIDATLELNQLPFKNGKVKLEGVDLRNRRPYAYRITFFGNTVSIKDLIGEDKLGVLPLSNYNEEYSAGNVIDLLKQNPDNADVIIPLITHTQRLYYDSGDNTHETGNLYYNSGNKHGVKWTDLKMALRVHKIVEAIEQKYGITFSTDFFNDTNERYYNLFMWLHRKKGVVANPEQVQWVDTAIHPPGDGQLFYTYNDDAGTFGFYPDDFYYSSIRYYWGRNNADPIQIVVYKNGILFYQTVTLTSATGFVTLSDSTAEYNIVIRHRTTTTLSLSEVRITANAPLDPPITEEPEFSPLTLQDVKEFSVPQQIPEQKTIDFLTGLFKMFNLTAYVLDDGTVYVDTLDNFYANQRSTTDAYDISEYVDVTKSQVDAALPYRRINLKYKDTDTFLAAFHEMQFGKEWGEENYTQKVGDKYVDGQIYNVEAPFGHMKYERLYDLDDESLTTVQWGWSVDDNQEAYLGDPLLFYPVYRQIQDGTTNEQISIIVDFNSDGTMKQNQDVGGRINMPSNSVSFNPATSKANIHFYHENNEFTGGTAFDETLYKTYYKTYIENVFNTKRRMTKVTAYLPLKILLNFTLADRFDINGRRYLINSITTNLETGESRMELLNEV
jgi:hypothetical protein